MSPQPKEGKTMKETMMRFKDRQGAFIAIGFWTRRNKVMNIEIRNPQTLEVEFFEIAQTSHLTTKGA
jgi:hypothetical protein